MASLRTTVDQKAPAEWEQTKTDQAAAYERDGAYTQELAATGVDGVTREVHVYDGPLGAGYSLILTVVENGVTYRKVLHEGPETYRDVAGWQAVERMK